MDRDEAQHDIELVEDESDGAMSTETVQFVDDAGAAVVPSSSTSNELNNKTTVAAPPPVTEPVPSGSQKKTARRRVGVGRVNVVPSFEQEDSNPSSSINISDDSNDNDTSDNNSKASNNRSDRLDKALFDQGTREFMQDFDPSLRNKQKRRKRFAQDGKQKIYADDYSECECLRKNCPGCHFPCRVCQDPRCGHECRNARKWLYSEVIYEGKNIELRNHRNTNLQ